MSDLILKTLNDLSPTLDPDFIYLKRELDTLFLHRRFSKTPGESVSMVTQRISDTRKKAMKIAPHTCIRECLFAESRIDRHFAYRQVLLIVAQTPSKTLIDVGCCMATDIRTLITHGYPISNITGLDCETGFIQLSFSLYNQSQYSFGAQFRVADVLDPRLRERCGDLDSKFDFVHTANVIHLYDEAQQEVLLRALAFLVKPGGLVWGRQVGIEERSIDQHRQPEGKGVRFTMNQFRRLWLAATGWETASGQFEAILTPYDELRTPRKDKRFSMQWSIRAPVEAPTRRLVELINPMGCT
ncbi:hypothetical protein N7G274_009613 [Stereocaulon virgatum]|uniref:Methyltransferase domain-containing protein n=1 Tax=Stereocaulon virgatum TaxID=373712 RepID=A0ABR3ZY35_9LECA